MAEEIVTCKPKAREKLGYCAITAWKEFDEHGDIR